MNEPTMREAADVIRTTTDYEPQRRVDAVHAWALELYRRGIEAERMRQRHVADQHSAAFAEDARRLVERAAAGFLDDITRAAQRQAEHDSLPWHQRVPLGG